MERAKYRKRDNRIVTAVQLNLDTDGFNYTKWGNEQQCRPGDWLVNNAGSCYTISKDSFDKTYSEIAPGQFVKTAPVWAVVANDDGRIKTNEGYTEYFKGDYLVANNPDGSDSYAVSKSKFEEMYEQTN